MNILNKITGLLVMSVSLITPSIAKSNEVSQANNSSIDNTTTTDIKINSVQEMSAEKLLNIIKKTDTKYQIIDVRSVKEFQEGHIPNAINIPHTAILKNMSLLDPYIDKELVFHCRSGYRAGLVTDKLSIQKYKAVHHLTGDIKEWKKNNYPLVK